MSSRRRKWVGGAWFVAAAVAFLAAVVYLIVLAVQGVNLTDVSDDALFWVFAAAGLLALLGWWRERGVVSDLTEKERDRERLESELQEREESLRETRDQLESARENEAEERRSREQRESELKERENTLSRERYLRSRAERAYQLEHDWSTQLHEEVMRLYNERGALGDSGDVPSMVLRLALTLLDAGKGMLLQRPDEDPDGELELASAEGFEHDPSESQVARRFAEEVIERDTIVRENQVEDPDGGTPADAEIENLVAIPIYVRDDFDGVVVCANKEGGFDDYDDEVLLSLGNHAGAVLENGRLRGELRNSYLATVAVLARAIEAKDPFLRGHSEEVSSYVAAVADRLGFDERRREELVFGSLLHDVGKIGISERILLKPTALTSEEFNVVKLHPRIGYLLVEQVPALRPIARAILHHHERFDGGGYPSGLRGEQIPLEARIICVADAFSAMIAERPYRGRMSLEEACAELERCAGTQFDPEVVRLFVEEIRRRPPAEERVDALAEALNDPELETQRSGDEPILGYGSFAVTDNLTLLYSHRYFHEVAASEAQRAAVQGSTFAVILVELTGIAELNRTEGYAAGDAALQKVARAVQWAATRAGGTACRHGGRRLGIIVPGADLTSGEKLAAEISGELAIGPKLATGVAAWSPGSTGDDVIEDALARLKNRAA